MNKTVLVTGGAGYIGSHTVIELCGAGFEPVIVDNLTNSSREAVRRVEKIVGRQITFYQADVQDASALQVVFEKHHPEAVIHFAGLKAVGESVAKPLSYYRNNIDSTLTLCEIMQEVGVKQLVFSSSATIYGVPQELPLRETSPKGPIPNPYGQTKAMIEQILGDLAVSDKAWQISLLRYFNPVGAHSSGQIGEDPSDIPNNLMPVVTQVAVGRLEQLRVFGDDYDTPDGTGVRDYIHVVDLAKGHVAALQHMPAPGKAETYNLGTGRGYSVLEMVHAFEKASGTKIPYAIAGRRQGDVAMCYADASKAGQELGWRAEKSLETMCADAWRWQSQNPNGYRTEPGQLIPTTSLPSDRLPTHAETPQPR
jgi:UDP-glucose 4-epimerase